MAISHRFASKIRSIGRGGTSFGNAPIWSNFISSRDRTSQWLEARWIVAQRTPKVDISLSDSFIIIKIIHKTDRPSLRPVYAPRIQEHQKWPPLFFTPREYFFIDKNSI